jgi:hypothetical protein
VPLVRISHRALVDTIRVPELDRFQILSEHEPGDRPARTTSSSSRSRSAPAARSRRSARFSLV